MLERGRAFYVLIGLFWDGCRSWEIFFLSDICCCCSPSSNLKNPRPIFSIRSNDFVEISAHRTCIFVIFLLFGSESFNFEEKIWRVQVGG